MLDSVATWVKVSRWQVAENDLTITYLSSAAFNWMACMNSKQMLPSYQYHT
jgi:hypothetical protein